MPARFLIDEEFLRQRILKGYQEYRDWPGTVSSILAAVRQFLSGPPGGDGLARTYWFEEDPMAAVAFVSELDTAQAGLAREVLAPLLAAAKRYESSHPEDPRGGEPRRGELVPNLSVFMGSLAGAVAVKASLDEALASALLSAALLGISRLGREPFAEAIGRRAP